MFAWHGCAEWSCFSKGTTLQRLAMQFRRIVDAWRVPPSAFTQALTAGNVGFMIDSVCAGLLGDRIGRKTMLISCIVTFGAFSLISAFARSPLQLAGLRFLTGLGRGAGPPITVALAYDFCYRWRVAAGDDATARHLAAEALRATRRTIPAQSGGAVSEGACSKHHVAQGHKRAQSARHLLHPAVDASYSDSSGVSPSRAILGTTMYGLGTIAVRYSRL
jgi:hypothetical protein